MEKNIITYKDLYKHVHSKFHYKYFKNEEAVNKILIEKVVFNEKCHLVAVFKDFLITDDDFEFIKKYYNLNKTFKKLKIYLQYYEQYSILYPNYIALSESKYLYKNIHKKQRIIDKLQDLEKDNFYKKYKKFVINKEYENNKIKDIFNSSIYNSILKGSENGGISIFGLSNKDHKDEEDNISISFIKDLIDNIDSSERIKKFEKNNYKNKNEYIKNDINNKKKSYKNKIKGYTNNTTNNNTNISLNTVKSNTLKNNNSITENNFTLNQGSNTNMDKLLSKEKEQDNTITQKFKSNILNKMKNHYRKNIIFPLKETYTNKNLYLSFKKKL